jgi:hypothetical protein
LNFYGIPYPQGSKNFFPIGVKEVNLYCKYMFSGGKSPMNIHLRHQTDPFAKMKIRLDKSGKIVYHIIEKYNRGGVTPKRRTEYHYG